MNEESILGPIFNVNVCFRVDKKSELLKFVKAFVGGCNLSNLVLLKFRFKRLGEIRIPG